MYDRPAAGCKHIKSVLRNGCLAGPDRSAGRNDLGVGIAIIGSVQNRRHERTRRRCACGEMMLAPLLRMDDGAGHQIVEVQFDGGGAQYAYAWRGQRAERRSTCAGRCAGRTAAGDRGGLGK